MVKARLYGSPPTLVSLIFPVCKLTGVRRVYEEVEMVQVKRIRNRLGKLVGQLYRTDLQVIVVIQPIG